MHITHSAERSRCTSCLLAGAASLPPLPPADLQPPMHLHREAPLTLLEDSIAGCRCRDAFKVGCHLAASSCAGATAAGLLHRAAHTLARLRLRQGLKFACAASGDEWHAGRSERDTRGLPTCADLPPADALPGGQGVPALHGAAAAAAAAAARQRRRRCSRVGSSSGGSGGGSS